MTQSPARMIRRSPSMSTTPSPSITCSVWGTGWTCGFVREPASNQTTIHSVPPWVSASLRNCCQTVPGNHSGCAGAFAASRSILTIRIDPPVDVALRGSIEARRAGCGRQPRDSIAGMRRLLALACSIVLVDTVFFAALSPLLPRFSDELDLSKGEAGLLVAMYALGGVLGAIPSGLAATRLGVKVTVALGLTLVAASSVLFGIVSDYWLLDVTRLVQGIASAFCWTGALAWLVNATSPERRGETIGISMSAAIVGALLGPVLGAAAVHFGRPAAFSGVAVVALALALLALRTPSPPPGERQPLRLMLVAVRERSVYTG